MNYRNLNDYELVQQFQQGCNASFEILMERYKQKVYTYILFTIKNASLAEDIFQDTFFKVIKSLKDKKYNHDNRFLSWMIRIAHNLIIDHFRKSNNRQVFSYDGEDTSFLLNKNKYSKSTEDDIVKDQVATDVKKLIQKLPFEQREVIVLRHYIGMSFKEIAAQTNVSINTALGRMRYGLLNMKKMIEENNMVMLMEY